MTPFRYSDIERELVDVLPEVRPAAEFYWTHEGKQGRDSGPYIFFEGLFACYVEVLLWLPPSARRDALLRRAFAVVEQMLEATDPDVRTLAMVGLYEGRDPGWLKRARSFVGKRGREWLNTYEPLWGDCASADDQIVPEILDGYHVRQVIACELGCPIEQVPGTTYTKEGLPNMPLQPTSGVAEPADSQ